MTDQKTDFVQQMQALLNERFHTSPERRVLNSYDATNTCHLPEYVAEPETEEEVRQLVVICTAHGIPIVPRGAGCGFSGGALPTEGGLVLNLSRMRELRIDRNNLVAEVQPGVVTGDIHEAAEAVGLLYPPDPASTDISTIGGNIAENAGGSRAVKYGVTGDYVLALRVVLMNGSIMTFGSPLRKDVAGYAMARLLVGSEGTLAIITRAWLKLIPRPASTRSAMLLFETAGDAASTISSVVAGGLSPSRLEIMDESCLTALRESGETVDEDANAVLLVEVDGPTDTLDTQLDQILKVTREHAMIGSTTAADENENEHIWAIRKKLSPIINTFGDTKMNEDVVVPRSKIPDLFQRVDELRNQHQLQIVCFGHAGDGNIHVNIMFDRDEPGITERVESALHELFRYVTGIGGSISGEHGIGTAKQRFMHYQFTPDQIQLMRRVKQLFDPDNLLNPGKIFPEEAP